MPPHATHRLNMVLTPTLERRLQPQALERLWGELQDQEFIDSRGRAGARAPELVEGGFALLRVDRPMGLAVYGNRVGGFHVACPNCRAPLARPWGAALHATHGGHPWALSCSECGTALGPNQVSTSPLARVARFALELRDTGSPDLVKRAPFQELLGSDFQVVLVRGT